MSPIQTSPEITQKITQHAMLVIWGLFARRLGLVQAIEAIELKQKNAHPHAANEDTGVPGRHTGQLGTFARHQPFGSSVGSGPPGGGGVGANGRAETIGTTVRS